MANFNSVAVAQKKPVPGFGAGGGQVRTQYTTVAIATGATTTDTIQLFDLPPHARVLGLVVKSAALGGTTTLNIGDGGYGDVVADPDRYLAANNITTAGGVVDAMAATGVFFKTGQRRLRITASFAAGTVGTAGNLEVAMSYTVEEPQA